MAKTALSLIGGSILGTAGKALFGKKKDDTPDPNAAQLTTAPAPDDTLARIEAERRLRKERGDSGRSGSILSTGTLG